MSLAFGSIMPASQDTVLDAQNSGVVNLSTNIFLSGPTYQLYVASQAATASVYVASNTFYPVQTLPGDSYGLYIAGGSHVMARNNSFYYQGSDFSGGSWSRVAAYIGNSSNIQFQHNRINEPGVVKL